MSLKICSLSSGSSGNCTFVASEKTKLLIDVGISATQVEKSLRVLGANPSDVNVLITHSHGDHVGGLNVFAKRNGIKTHCHFLSTNEVKKKAAVTEFDDDEFTIGDISITPFRVSHDVPCVGYTMRSGKNQISVLTDLGCIDCRIMDAIRGSDIVMIESNHDEQILNNNDKYAYFLKRRILSEKGHLSNNACSGACVELAKFGTKQIILAHLSKENNYPELAFNQTAKKLSDAGIVEGRDIQIEVAKASAMSGLYEVV